MKPVVADAGAPVANPGGGIRARTAACEMPIRGCGATAFLRDGGPVRVPFRACCAAALVQGLRGAGSEEPG